METMKRELKDAFRYIVEREREKLIFLSLQIV